MLKIHAVHNTDWPCSDEIARQHTHRGAGHRCVRQALAEGGLNLEAQLAGGLLGAVERDLVGNAHAVRVARLVALGLQLLVDLGPKAVHQHDLHAHALDHGQILRDVGQLVRGNRLTRHAHDKGLAPVHVDIGRHGAEPGHESEVENGGHGRGKAGRRTGRRSVIGRRGHAATGGTDNRQHAFVHCVSRIPSCLRQACRDQRRHGAAPGGDRVRGNRLRQDHAVAQDRPGHGARQVQCAARHTTAQAPADRPHPAAPNRRQQRGQAHRRGTEHAARRGRGLQGAVSGPALAQCLGQADDGRHSAGGNADRPFAQGL